MKKGVLTFGILVLLMAGTGLWGCGRNREQSDSPILIEPSKKIQTEETTLYEPQIFTQKEAVLSEELSQGVESETTLEPLATEENPDSFLQNEHLKKQFGNYMHEMERLEVEDAEHFRCDISDYIFYSDIVAYANKPKAENIAASMRRNKNG